MVCLSKKFTFTRSRYIFRIWWRGGSQGDGHAPAEIFPEVGALVDSVVDADGGEGESE
jgi:hypothetical protein